MGDELLINKWVNQFKLPNDDFSKDNAIIIQYSSRWPLLIDPQVQANIWIREMEGNKGEEREDAPKTSKDKDKNQKKSSSLYILRPSSKPKEVEMVLENAISNGLTVLLENITEKIDPIYEPVLQKKLVKQGNQYKLKFGEKVIDYSTDFRFYMTTKLGRPHYPPGTPF